jgi:hypothetical protein
MMKYHGTCHTKILSDFFAKVTAHLLQTVLSRFDFARVEPHCFALNRDDGGAFRRRIAHSVGSDATGPLRLSAKCEPLPFTNTLKLY